MICYSLGLAQLQTAISHQVEFVERGKPDLHRHQRKADRKGCRQEAGYWILIGFGDFLQGSRIGFVMLCFPPALPGAPGRQAGDDDRQLSRLDRLGDVHVKT